MTAKELETKVLEKAIEFGILTQAMKDRDGKRGTPNAMQRSNLNSYKDGKSYFGYVRPEETPSGPYYDLSFVIFPQENEGKCVVSLGVGSAGFQRDYDLVSTTGTRRLFTRLTKNDGNFFVKNDFMDIESPVKDLQDKIAEIAPDLNSVIETYKNVLLASCIVDPDEELGIIVAWLAQYAKLRNWGTKVQQKAQDEAIKPYLNTQPVDIQNDVERLLKNSRYVILQGAPGTGKTYNALEISKKYKKTHFIQFHAETTYSDFVEGIKPDTTSGSMSFIHQDGELIKAIKSAKDMPDERVLLIIDEINRANLANVLGPIFFLFENQVGTRKVTLKVGNEELSQLPSNLDVIATMNTADRSLAVVDFALRRRFVWYTIRPQKITPDNDYTFHEKIFNRFCEIFDRYATDEELNLQPGPSYFLTPKASDDNNIMRDRLVYELMPLIKEYLAEGLMKKAANSFAQLFYEETGKYLYE